MSGNHSKRNHPSPYGDPGDHRRKWDRDEYEQMAKARIEAEQRRDRGEDRDFKDPEPEREMLKARDYKVDLEGKLGKSVVVTKTTPNAESGGYYCNVCDCVVKDSINFLDHINGKKHQRNMGMSMKIERSTLDQVKKRFESKKKEMEKKKKDYDIEERMKELKEEEEKMKSFRREKRKNKKRKAEGELDEDDEEEAGGSMDPDMAAMMGFGGFSASKTKN